MLHHTDTTTLVDIVSDLTLRCRSTADVRHGTGTKAGYGR